MSKSNVVSKSVQSKFSFSSYILTDKRNATFVFCVYLDKYSKFCTNLLLCDSLLYTLSVIHIANIKSMKRNHSVRPASLVHVHLVRIYATTTEGRLSIKTTRISPQYGKNTKCTNVCALVPEKRNWNVHRWSVCRNHSHFFFDATEHLKINCYDDTINWSNRSSIPIWMTESDHIAAENSYTQNFT